MNIQKRILIWLAGAIAGAACTWFLLDSSAAAPEWNTIKIPNVESAPRTTATSVPAEHTKNIDPPRSAADISNKPEAREAPLDSCIVYGRVTDGNGAPVRDVMITFTRGEEESIDVRPTADGNYSIYGLHPGLWNGRCRVNGYSEGPQTVFLDIKDPAQRVDFVLQQKTNILIRFLTPEGELLKEALDKRGIRPYSGHNLIGVIASSEKPPALLPATPYAFYSNPNARFRGPMELMGSKDRLPADASGRLELNIPTPVYVTAVFRNFILTTVFVEKPVPQLDITISVDALLSNTCNVRLQLVDGETGAPIAGGSANLGNRQSSGAPAKGDGEGIIQFSGAAPGLLTLSYSGPSPYERIQQFIRVAPGESLDLGKIKLYKSTELSGIVVDSKGTPVACDIQLVSENRSAFPAPADFHGAFTTKTDGRFSMHVPRSRHVLLISSREEDRSYAALPVDTTSGDVRDLQIVVKPGTPVTFDYKVAPYQSYISQVADANGSILQSIYVHAPTKRVLTLAPGNYKITLYDKDQPIREIPVQVTDSPAVIAVEEK